MSNLVIISVLIFVAASLAIYGAYWIFIFNHNTHKAVNRRLDLSRHQHDASVVLDTLRRERSLRNYINPVLRQCSDWLTQTAIQVQRTSLVLVFVALCLAFALVFGAILGIGIASLAFAVLAAATAMIAYFAYKRRRRISAFAEQLPDAIDVIVRGVRVGFPFSSAVSLVAREMPDPAGTEFGMLADEIAFGLDVRTGLQNLYRRVGQEDLLFLTVALSIQAQTGGNIGEILTRLSRLMRKRAEMNLKIRALSAEGRASAYFLSAFPFILILVIHLLSPQYFEAIRSSQLLEPAIFVGLSLLIVANIIMYRMVHFKY